MNCPNCTSPIRASRRNLDGDGYRYCHDCGWDEETNFVLSDESAWQELLDAADDLLNSVHRSDESFATDAMLRSQAQRLREEAERIETRDARIRRLQRAVVVVRGRTDANQDSERDDG